MLFINKVLLDLYQITKQKNRIMKTIIEEKGFKVTFNGSCTWFVVDSNGDAWFSTNTERKALNRFKKIYSTLSK